MRLMLCLCLLGKLVLATTTFAEDLVQPEWGTISPLSADSGIYRCEVKTWPTDGRLKMPTPFPQIIACAAEEAVSRGLDFAFNTEATELHILAPVKNEPPVTRFLLHTSEKTKQYPDGRILFSALDAVVQGQGAKLEQHPGNYRVGFWSNPADYVTWNYDASRWGMYAVRLTYSNASPAGSEIEVEIGGAKVSQALKSTGSWYRYTTLELGTLYLPQSGQHTLSVKCVKKVGGAIMNLKAVSLIPACEGKPPVQGAEGEIVLHGSDATVRGTNLRYEPNPKKLTLGYWTRPTDAAAWRFTVNTPGAFQVEVLQGCGTGAGGSEMLLETHSQPLRFIVEDTGHFQNFQPRMVGVVKFPAPGEYDLHVVPEKIAKNAALDLRQVRLIPVR